jgi:hypothetical protein
MINSRAIRGGVGIGIGERYQLVRIWFLFCSYRGMASDVHELTPEDFNARGG